VGNDAQFARLLGVLGLAADPRYATNADRVAARQNLIEWLSAAIAARGRDELVEALRGADVPAGPVSSVAEAVAAMEDAHAGWTQTIGGMRLAPGPIRLDGESLPPRGAPPLLGQHTDEILGEIGLSRGEIQELRRSRIVA
jgi:crotonobetainyl-CoA:carnitine CoA-transferase CaiB-like acyl-CoA transferase